MKILYLLRHSVPERAEKPTELLSLNEEGIALAKSERAAFRNVDRCYSSPYRRAAETAELLSDRVTIIDDLRERTVGDGREDFWLKQYLDHDYRSPGGESLNDVRLRMTAAVDSVLSALREGESALIVSHAAAICSYLLNFCGIEVTDAAEKRRRITFRGQTILDGRFEPMNCFELNFENDALVSICFRAQPRAGYAPPDKK